jgi:hypothetical protein
MEKGPAPKNLEDSLGFPKDFILQYSLDEGGLTCDPTRAEFSRDSNWRPFTARA